MTRVKVILAAILLFTLTTILPVSECQVALPVHLQTANVTAPQLRLAWSLEPAGASRGIHEIAYEVRVATSLELLAADKPDLWSSGRVTSSSLNAVYAGKPLPRGTSVAWQVRSWQTWIGEQNFQASPWSAPSTFMTGLANWSARWIAATPDASPGSPLGVANDIRLPIFRRSVKASRCAASASS